VGRPIVGSWQGRNVAGLRVVVLLIVAEAEFTNPSLERILGRMASRSAMASLICRRLRFDQAR